ncbi:hypothetical protein ACLVWQ_24425 [Streptomyces sp. CWNU-52B]|uniref:hypothetical protein n=1 Tax=unclassified Streptomyces TaxID=2593676 RepID=UPI0039C20AB4
MSDVFVVATVTASIATVVGALTYPLVRLDLGPAGALLASGVTAVAVGVGWLLVLFHALLGFAVGVVVYLVARRKLTGAQAAVAGAVSYVVGTLLSVGALIVALSGM